LSERYKYIGLPLRKKQKEDIVKEREEGRKTGRIERKKNERQRSKIEERRKKKERKIQKGRKEERKTDKKEEAWDRIKKRNIYRENVTILILSHLFICDLSMRPQSSSCKDNQNVCRIIRKCTEQLNIYLMVYRAGLVAFNPNRCVF
jgi:hypothetical protein